MRIGLKSPRVNAAVAGALVVMTAGAAIGDAAERYYERAFVLAAHQRCGLFEPAVVAALESAAGQARGAALRAGVAEADLTQRAGRARARAATTPCASSDLALAAGRVRHAFAGWARQARMTFPGDKQGWTADRTAYARPTWRLTQASVVGASPVAFGFVAGPRTPQQLSAVVSFVGRPRPYAARIVMRDRQKAQTAWLARAGQAALPPETVRRAFWATANETADPGLLAEGRARGETWAFPIPAADALALLDPRERFVVEFLFRDDSIASAEFEAGDFAAGRAFLNMGTL